MAKKISNTNSFKTLDNEFHANANAAYTVAINGIGNNVIQPGTTLTQAATAYIHTVDLPYSTSAVHIQSLTISGNNAYLAYSHDIPLGTIYWNGSNYTNYLSGNVYVTNTIMHSTTAFGSYFMVASSYNSLSAGATEDVYPHTNTTTTYTITGFGAGYTVGYNSTDDSVIQPNSILTQAVSAYVSAIDPSYSISAVEIQSLSISGNNPYLSYSHDVPTGTLIWNGASRVNVLSGNVYVTNTQTHPTTAFGEYFMTATTISTLSTGRWATATANVTNTTSHYATAFGGDLYPGALAGETKQRTMSRLLEEGII